MSNVRGLDFFSEVRSSLPNYNFDVIFDVGANVGQSLKEFLRESNADVYAFEPVNSTFEVLSEHYAGESRAQLFPTALGAVGRSGRMLVGSNSTTNSLFFGSDSQKNESAALEQVEIDTLDNFCIERNIEKIGFLKIDTEGHDLEVLKGAAGLLALQNIDFLQCEVGMHSGNDRHVSFEKLHGFMNAFEYLPFGFYEQTKEFYFRFPYLRRINVTYISRSLSERFRG